MAYAFPYSWKEIVATLAIAGILLAIMLYDGAPSWLRLTIGVLVYVGPMLPFLALIPWHFIAKYRGLASRSSIPCIVSCAEGVVLVEQGDKRSSHSLDRVVRARFASNDNWTESKMLEDALGLFGSNGREMVRVPESARGFDALQAELIARGIPIEHVDVSAPAVLD